MSSTRHFKLVEELGRSAFFFLRSSPRFDGLFRGTFATVHRAIDVITQQTVAVKVIAKSEHDNHHDVLNEVQIMRHAKHSSIVELLWVTDTAEHYILGLEFMDGGELFCQLQRLVYFSEDLSRHVTFQVARGIQYLHRQGSRASRHQARKCAFQSNSYCSISLAKVPTKL
ncbi:Pkinase-domain-containing protein [Mycena venus]|uniref:Pkinase-domain-containing protein n=1 Tax=Mycena venus TaxID=2733690 RepID=A0A8H6Z891_9AGAR|nr:Pkinase-domain-containing protein [Mycena venus]